MEVLYKYQYDQWRRLRFTSAMSTGMMFIGTVDRGMIRLDHNNTSSEFIFDGPTRTGLFGFSIFNELWVATGYNVFITPFPLEQFGISHFEEGVWINYTPITGQ
jgi:hypothetical protein